MEREIKFRAWDNEKKVMIKSVWEIGLGVLEDSETWIVGDDKHVKNFELMQFTGLKDKNGKEIYEGDVVDVRMDRPRGTAFVEWADGGFIIRTEYGMRADICIVLDHLIEVIGNIYENPELLEQGLMKGE